MSVRKMRGIAEAATPLAPRLREENLRSAFELSVTCMRLRPSARLRGVRRCRSVEDGREPAIPPPDLPRPRRRGRRPVGGA